MTKEVEHPLVSIIIPVYNVAEYLSATLESLLNQSYNNLQIIIVNDGSTDKSWNVIQKYADKYPQIEAYNQENGGAAKARNVGLSKVKGEFIMFVDGDDMISEETIEANIPYLINNKSLDWVAFSILRVDEKRKRIDIGNLYGNKEFKENRIILSHEFVPCFEANILSGLCCGAIYRFASVKQIKFPVGEFYEDGFFFTDLLVSTKVGMLSKKGSYFYVNRGGSSQLKPLDYPHLVSDLNCATKRLELYRKNYPQFEKTYQFWENRLYYYYKNEMIKGTEGACIVFNKFVESIKPSHKIDLLKELKFLIYQIFGYKNLKRIYNYVKKTA